MSGRRWLGATLLALVLTIPASAEVIEVKEFDSKALKAAIQQAHSGDTVQLPEGTFELTEPIQPKSGIKLLGKGQEKTTVAYKGANPSALISFSRCEDVEIAHLKLDGRNNPLVHQGVVGNDSRRLWVHHLTICNLKAKTFGPHAIHFYGHEPMMADGVTDSRITNCRIENIGLDAEYGGGIRLSSGSVRNQVLGNTVRNTGRGGIFGDHSGELVIRNNKVSGSGGEGLGIEIWSGCPRSLIEENEVDHWISVDQGNQSAVRRNVIGTDDGTLKGYGIEILARDMVVTDNVVNRGAHIGLSVSSKAVKNNVFWGYNTIRDCIQWGAQLQGETGGMARHYFYRCSFSNTVRGDTRATYPQDSGHGFRTNGNCRELVCEDCTFDRNGGYGLQLGGDKVDAIAFLRSSIRSNGLKAIAGPFQYTALEFVGCKVDGNQGDQLPEAKPFSGPVPVAGFRLPETVRAGTSVHFQCLSQVSSGEIVEWLWDFGDGIPETTVAPEHTFGRPGSYRVTLIVWDRAGRGGRAEKMVRVLPK
jgi:parallel beta-helix repeat protein